MAPDKILVKFQKAPSGRLFYSRFLMGGALALAVASWLNPNHYPPWIVFENEAAAFASVLLAALAFLVRGRSASVASGYIAFVLTTVLVVLAQYLLGVVSWQVFALGCLYLSALAVSLVVGYGLYQNQQTVADAFERKALFALLLATLVSAGVVLGQWLSIESHYPLLMSAHGNFRPYGNLGQPNNQATFLVTGLLCIELLRRKKAISWQVVSASIFLLIPAVAATGSRTAILSAMVAAIYLLGIGKVRRFGFTAGWLLVLLACSVMLPELGGAGEATGGSRISTSTAESSPRMQIYKQLFWAISERPWTGYGWMQTAYAQSVAAADVFGGVEVDYAHNICIDFFVWFGIPIGALLLTVLGFSIVSIWHRTSAHYRIAYVLFVPFVVHSFLELPFAYAFFLLPAGVLLGYLGVNGIGDADDYVMSLKIGWKTFTLVFAAATLMAIVVFNDYLDLSEDYRVLRFENKKIGSVPEGFQQSTPWILTDMRFMMDAFRYKPFRGETKENVELLRQHVLHGHYPGAHVKLISQELLDHHFEAAASEIHRFKNLYGEPIVNWGMSSMSSAFCEDPKSKASNLQECCVLSGETLCNRESL